MVSFSAPIQKFGNQGEKTGWTYVLIPHDIAAQIKPGIKKTFRVKGLIDHSAINSVALMPMGGGDYILVLNAAMRKAIRKKAGDILNLQLEEDTATIPLPEDLLACLEDEPDAKAHFFSLPPSHRLYYGRWINEAKTEATRTKRIAQAITALVKEKDFGAMIRENKKGA